jgi:hypothetical protein
MFWDDMVRLSRGCPAIMQSAIFLSQRKMKNEAAHPRNDTSS